MATNIVYLFLDTNFFIQCRPLAELDWSDWDSFDEVHLVVTRPVQREIDKQKNKGSERIGKRARKTHSLFRKLITGERGYKLISEANPQVRLLVEPSYRPNPDLADQLDYHETDDALIGCVHAYLQENPTAIVRLVTHDSGPMGTAKMLGIPFFAVPDSWLISPETTEDEKKISRLENDLSRLKKTEPEVQVSCLDDKACEVDTLKLEHSIFEPLNDREISYKPERPVLPVKSINLECKQWRHGVEDHHFQGDIFFDQDIAEIRGALECRIHAENMSSPVDKAVRVRIRIMRTNVLDRANKLIVELIKRSRY